MLIIFGCLVPFAMFPKSNRTKLNLKANKSVFVGYDSYRKGWRCMDPDTKKFTNSKDVVFDEVSSLFSTPEIFSLDDDQANLVLLFPTTNAQAPCFEEATNTTPVQNVTRRENGHQQAMRRLTREKRQCHATNPAR